MHVKRPVIVTAIVTESLKAEYLREIEESMRRITENQKEMETQSRRYMLQIPNAEMATSFRRQVEEETRKLDNAQRELTERKAEVEQLEIDEQVTYMQLEGYVDLREGDNIRDRLGRAEILIKDGIIQEIRENKSDPSPAPESGLVISRG